MTIVNTVNETVALFVWGIGAGGLLQRAAPHRSQHSDIICTLRALFLAYDAILGGKSKSSEKCKNSQGSGCTSDQLNPNLLGVRLMLP